MLCTLFTAVALSLSARSSAASADWPPTALNTIPQLAGESPVLAAPRDLEGLSTPIGIPVDGVIRLASGGQSRGTQVVRVDLGSIFNRHLKAAESFGDGAGKFFLSTQANLKGDAFLAVQKTDWADPIFFRFTSDLEGKWSGNGTSYNATIDGSLFRRRFNNRLVIQDGKTQKDVYNRRLTDFFYSSYLTGQDVSIGGRNYKLFYSNQVDSSRSPAVFDKSTFGICLLYDESRDPSYHDMKSYPIPLDAIRGQQPVGYRLHGDQVLYFQLSDDGTTLVISD